MNEDAPDSMRGDAPPAVTVRFWWLVVLAKLAILTVGFGVIAVTFTRFRIAGIALVVIGLGIGVRWAVLFRRSRRALAAGGIGGDSS